MSDTRRDFIKAAAATGVIAAGAGLGTVGGASAQAGAMPQDTGTAGKRVAIRNGAVLSMDPEVGDFENADVLIEGSRIVAIGPNLDVGDAEVIEAAGMIVMPGFIDTHHHQFETAIRSALPNALLFNDGQPHGAFNYAEYVLGNFSLKYRPEDVHISEVFGALSQLDAGVTTVMDVSQIHHSPEHSDAAIQGIRDSGRRTAFGYFEGHGDASRYPGDARRIREQYFSSDDQLLTMVMGGEIYLPGYEETWKIGRELEIPIAVHIVGSFGMQPTFDELAKAGQFGPDNLFIHMTGMSDAGWQATKDAGASVSLAVPIEMMMRHGLPPIMKTLEMGVQPSLSSDVECTLTADFFTQMRSAMTLQRSIVNQAALEGMEDLPELLTCRDVIRFATVEGAKALKLDAKTGTLTPGKEADIILLDAEAINVAPLNNVPGAVVTLMERSNVDTVLVAGRIRKWRGRLLDADVPKLRRELEASRDYLFEVAGVQQDLFRD
ncbi:amidohydrolase family protein [Microbaculum marinum]|uniref:Amidohydrolase family protein n=1 Tax=Microbaculum marinum TaxID=1764581 RepID=A0AAW9RUR2_9HYPH